MGSNYQYLADTGRWRSLEFKLWKIVIFSRYQKHANAPRVRKNRANPLHRSMPREMVPPSTPFTPYQKCRRPPHLPPSIRPVNRRNNPWPRIRDRTFQSFRVRHPWIKYERNPAKQRELDHWLQLFKSIKIRLRRLKKCEHDQTNFQNRKPLRQPRPKILDLDVDRERPIRPRDAPIQLLAPIPHLWGEEAYQAGLDQGRHQPCLIPLQLQREQHSVWMEPHLHD